MVVVSVSVSGRLPTVTFLICFREKGVSKPSARHDVFALGSRCFP
jgi:hypothetical protein